jgi:hypothetical protein
LELNRNAAPRANRKLRDFLDLGRERLGFVIGGIASKVTAGVLLMANLQANLRSQCAIAADQPRLFLRSVNQRLPNMTMRCGGCAAQTADILPRFCSGA